MGLSERLTEDMKAAMKAGPDGKLRLETIRYLRAAIRNLEIDKHTALSDEEILGIIAKQVKQLKDSVVEFEKGGRTDLIAKAQAEVTILTDYLPMQMGESEVRELVRLIIVEVGALGSKDMGKVMGPLMVRTKGRADGKLVSQVVPEMLT